MVEPGPLMFGPLIRERHKRNKEYDLQAKLLEETQLQLEAEGALYESDYDFSYED